MTTIHPDETASALQALASELADLESAEDFLNHFQIPFDPAILAVNRLHILQRFHDYLGGLDGGPDGSQDPRERHVELLRRAYQDFVRSDARTEKVFRVFQMQPPARVEVSLDELTASRLPKRPAPSRHAS
jgi:nitrogenase-stabilizing/protective protein